MKKIFIFLSISTTILLSCNYSGHITKRYKSVSLVESNEKINKMIAVDAYIIEKKDSVSAKPKTIFDLSPKAQAVLIENICKKEAQPDNLIDKLTKVLSSKSDHSADIIDYSQFEKRIVVSIRNNSHMPADRISKITVTLDLGQDVKMLSCNRLATEYQTIDFGKLDYSNSLSTEGSGNITLGSGSSGKTGAGLSEKVSTNRAFSEEVLLKQRTVVLNVSIKENKLSLHQEGLSGIDLTGNIIADMTIGIKNLKVERVYSFSNLKNDTINSKPQNVTVNESFVIYPNLNDDIKANISFEADYRHVIKGDKTISESDDKVELLYGQVTNPNSEVIIPKNKIQPKFWKLVLNDDTTMTPIQIQSPSISCPVDLLFNSFDMARKFMVWLKLKYDDSKKEMQIGKDYTLQMPSSFKTIKNIDISLYN